jgi:ElaA protein
MEIAIKESQTHYPREEIIIHAQTYLIDFYTSFGFQKFGSEFLEAGIPHQGMSMLPEQPAY